MKIEAGKTYTAYRQGTAITPATKQVKVVWIEGDSVHYRLEGSDVVKQTPLDRFIEIITPPEANRIK